MAIAVPIRIIQLSTLWNIQSILALSTSYYYYRGRICRSRSFVNKPSALLQHHPLRVTHDDKNFMISSSSTPTDMQDEGENKGAAVRRSPRKICAKPPASASSSASTTATNNLAPSSMNGFALLEQWIQHDHHTYHLDHLSPERACKIRTALVQWYRANRRKLPWRGDAGPYDGSTAGYGVAANASAAAGTVTSATATIASSGGKNKRKKIMKAENEGKDIRSFFTSSSSSSSSSLGTSQPKSMKVIEKDTLQTDETELLAVSSFQSTEVTAYGVWVSEIMLQQTRVEAVIPYWIKWMQGFPTVFSLAEATDEEVNSHWAGLGFYRRARLLHAGAKRVVDQYNGVVPNTVEELMKVEGIGRYTASAIASIAYGVEVPVVDGNVCRVLCRLTGIANHIKAGVLKDDLGWVLAERIIQAKRQPGRSDDDDYDDGTPGEVNQALMELGATYCCPGGSGVDIGDPLREYYISCQIGIAIGLAKDGTTNTNSTRIDSLIAKKSSGVTNVGKQCRLCDPTGITNAYFDVLDRTSDVNAGPRANDTHKIYAIAGHASLPIPPPKKSKREEVIAVAVISQTSSDNNRRWLMVKRPSEGLLASQWEFPSVCVWNSAEQEKTNKAKNGGMIEVPLIDHDIRSDALDSYLTEIFQSREHKSLVGDLQKRKQLNDAPVVHVFSHVCHTMWVEHVDLGAVAKCSLPVKRWESKGRELGWMSELDMKSVGITSGVRKVLAAARRS